ncbi:early boundary activity protein 2 [Drosophila sulfurigaster albostrigata]|uniref:early boundary activity protein 2 n=1 Tax=Drosophila sulfurigaster albostrigata TaxID=89887 RepID=UPI002D21BF5F|nr:early boundary activity protein 2 [Drosophila sulfurigaster albostrigata]
MTNMDEYTNIDVRRTCKSFLDDSSQQKQLARINRHPAFFQPQHSFSAPQLYPEFLKLFAPHFSPYHYNSAQMDLERLFNKPVSQEQQQQPTAKQHPPQGALAPSRPALVPFQQVPIAQRMPSNQLPPKKAIQRHPILNVKVVNKVELPPLEPLPPIEDSFMEEVKRIETTQGQYKMFFGRMMDMMDTLCRRYDGLEEEPEPMADSDDEETEEPPPPPSKRQRPIDRSATNSPDCDMSDEEEEEEEDLSKYPERIELPDGSYTYVLGPNGTTITSKEFGQVAWTDAPVATRGLLNVVFTSDDLATHTLTGKPSPAFYGRERPPKKMLDPDRVEDIIVSVMNRTGGKERHIRGTITTKCADTAKKYKRRAKKLAESEAINQGQGQ